MQNNFVAHPIEPQWQLPNPLARITDEPMKCRAALTYGAEMTVDWLMVPPGYRPYLAAEIERNLKQKILSCLYPLELTTELRRIQTEIYRICPGWAYNEDTRELGNRLGDLTSSLMDPKRAVRK